MFVQIIVSDDWEQKVRCFNASFECQPPEVAEDRDNEAGFTEGVRRHLAEGRGVDAWIESNLTIFLKPALRNALSMWLMSASE